MHCDSDEVVNELLSSSFIRKLFHCGKYVCSLVCWFKFLHLIYSALPLLLCRDGRVSESTVCLIRKLLVLDPQQRLTAAEVLESLSGIIASW